MSAFKDKVIQIVKMIPKGKVVSYGQVALMAGVPRGARQVGWILHEHGDDGPWWRIINNSGRISIKSPDHSPIVQKEKLGAKKYVKDSPFVSIADFPSGKKDKVDESLEQSEDYIVRVKEDIAAILKLLKKEAPAKIELFVASDWKRKLRMLAAKVKDFNTVMKSAMLDPELKPHAAEIARVLQQYMKNMGALGDTASADFELEALKSGKKILEREFGCVVEISREEESKAPKASFALPGKPSILIS